MHVSAEVGFGDGNVDLVGGPGLFIKRGVAASKESDGDDPLAAPLVLDVLNPTGEPMIAQVPDIDLTLKPSGGRSTHFVDPRIRYVHAAHSPIHGPCEVELHRLPRSEIGDASDLLSLPHAGTFVVVKHLAADGTVPLRGARRDDVEFPRLDRLDFPRLPAPLIKAEAVFERERMILWLDVSPEPRPFIILRVVQRVDTVGVQHRTDGNIAKFGGGTAVANPGEWEQDERLGFRRVVLFQIAVAENAERARTVDRVDADKFSRVIHADILRRKLAQLGHVFGLLRIGAEDKQQNDGKMVHGRLLIIAVETGRKLRRIRERPAGDNRQPWSPLRWP